LDVGEIGTNTDLNDFEKGKIVMASDWVRVSLKWQGLWVSLGQQW